MSDSTTLFNSINDEIELENIQKEKKTDKKISKLGVGIFVFVLFIVLYILYDNYVKKTDEKALNDIEKNANTILNIKTFDNSQSEESNLQFTE